MSEDNRWWSMFTLEEEKEIEDNIEKNAYYSDGKEEGKIEGARMIAQNMLQDNHPLEVIAKYTGLDIGEIKALNVSKE